MSPPKLDALTRVLALRDKPSRIVVGLQSGTSADGIDAAVAELAGSGEATRANLLACATIPYPDDVRTALLDPTRLPAAVLCTLDFELGGLFADAARIAVERAGLAPGAIDLVGSHGQTICHQPRSAGGRGATLQIGEAAVIAERLGVPVVADFRVRDVAAGGEGAPLVPLIDSLLFRARGETRLLLNLGGIANVSVVPDTLAGVRAFDTGPGNMALDLVTRAASGGVEAYDADGRRAARGTIDHALARELLGRPFFALPPPRSTGREEFGAAFVAPLLARHAGREDDLLATLTYVTAAAVRDAARRHVEPTSTLSAVYASGGGVRNATLMGHLRSLFAPIPVDTTAALGVDPSAKEALAFAILANEFLFGNAGNVTGATGAPPRVLGKLIP